MEVERDVDVFAANDDGCGGSDLKSESRISKRLRRSTSYDALSDRTLKRLAEAFFPKVSNCRLQEIKNSLLEKVSSSDIVGFHDDNDSLSEEYEIGSCFDMERPIYSNSYPHVPNVELGGQLNVLDLLGDNLLRFKQIKTPGFRASVSVESTSDLKGKFVMICCVFVPSIWCSDDGPMVYHTALASHELAKRRDFVLVVVPMMRTSFTFSHSAYTCFLSGFSCLSVPFDDCYRCEYICSALGFDGKLKAAIVDPYLKVLYHGPPNMFLEFGGAEHDFFPFTSRRREYCLSRNYVLQDLSLGELLGLRDTDDLFNISKDASIAISELKHKFVAIYVCSDCTSLRKVQELHEECRRKKHELEIVVVCCPFDRQVPPKLHKELIESAFESHQNPLGWWFFRFDNTVCHRLRRMCEVDSNGEGLFIVDPNEKYVDPYGLSIIRDFGMDCYPFTRRNLVEKEFQRVMGLRLKSLLLPWRCVSSMIATNISTIDINVKLLENKIVVLYLYKEKEKFLADKLAAWYKKNIKKKHSSVVEVVVVSIDGGGASDRYFMDKGWLVCRAHPSKSAKLCDEYFHPLCGPHEAVVAFGKDGQIQSMDASHILECQGPPFHGNLREEIGLEFDYGGFHYMRHYDYSFLKKGADIKLEINQRMGVEKDVDLFAANDGCGESDLNSESNLMHNCPSTSDKALSERTLKRLAEKASFPNVSECRLKQLKVAMYGTCSKDTSDRPDPQALSKEYKMGSYFDTECPIYSQSYRHVPNVELGKQLDVLDLLGDNLWSFNQNIPSFQPTKFGCDVGLCDPNMGAHGGIKCRNVQRIQPLEFTSSFDLKSTLGLKGKYIMICCVFVPSMWSSRDGSMVYHTALASPELARRDDFVLVVVPMMRKGFTHSSSAYENFLSGFSCLAVPFHDCDRRENICSALGFDGRIKAVILDPSQKVLHHGTPHAFVMLGGAEDGCFPYTQERELDCLSRGFALKDLSLNELLGLSDTDFLCNGWKEVFISISELKHKYVGIYVCSNGLSLRKVREVHEECKRREYELEIVVVCCPSYRVGLPPKVHEELIMDALASLKLLDLWFFPFNNTVSQRLGRMCESKSGEEGFFIVDPVEKCVDPYGLPIICDFGMDYYPFTRRSLFEKKYQRLTGLRLNSLLQPWTHVCRKVEGGITESHVEEALNKKVVILYLYAEKEKLLADKLTLLLVGGSDQKRKYPNVEVVAVSIDGSSTSEECFMDKGWWVCCADPTKSAKLCDQYFHPRYDSHEAVLAFGEDGHFQSMDALRLLESQAPPPFLGSDLEEELFQEFDYLGYDYMLLDFDFSPRRG